MRGGDFRAGRGTWRTGPRAVEATASPDCGETPSRSATDAAALEHTAAGGAAATRVGRSSRGPPDVRLQRRGGRYAATGPGGDDRVSRSVTVDRAARGAGLPVTGADHARIHRAEPSRGPAAGRRALGAIPQARAGAATL